MKSPAMFRPLTGGMDEHEKLCLIGLSHVDFLTPRNKVDLIKELGCAAAIYRLSLRDLGSLVGRRMRTKLWDPAAILGEAEKTLKRLTPGVVGCIFREDSTYPPQLAHTYDPPVTLFYRGKLPENGNQLVGIVGTRFPTGGARKAAFRLGFELGCRGVGVVSGLAMGIDREAHQGCVQAGGYSVAVLGNGIDRIYPSSSRAAAMALLEAGGTILSEYPPGTPALSWHFPARNRIISGLSHSVVIVQAPERSGALITARYATDQNKSVYVHTAGQWGSAGAGTRRLAADGAPVIAGARDIFRDWGREYPEAAEPGALPGESTGQRLARIFKGEMEGACATKAGETYWRA